MFSGIVEEAAKVVKLEKDRDNLHITLTCSFVNELKIDQSVSHNGVCLTVVKVTDDDYTVTAIKETLIKSNLGMLKVGDLVNLERSMLMNARIDGHFVQGHVDQTAVCTDVKEENGSCLECEFCNRHKRSFRGEWPFCFSSRCNWRDTSLVDLQVASLFQDYGSP